MVCGNAFAQAPIHDTTRVYDVVTENDTCYLFPSFKPCIMPWRYDWANGRTLVNEYVTSDTVTVYGVAITMKNMVAGQPIRDNISTFSALLLKRVGISPFTTVTHTEYTFQVVDSVTVNRSHPRFYWFLYEDSCGNMIRCRPPAKSSTSIRHSG